MNYSKPNTKPSSKAAVSKKVQKLEPNLEHPNLYTVTILNDDHTPMRFVVELLENIFHFDRATAIHLMMTIHTEGQGRCGQYSLEIARTKNQQVIQTARTHNHPLQSKVEELPNF